MTDKSQREIVYKEDNNILSFLRKNARQTLTKLSKNTGIPISTVFDRLKKMEETGVIKKHTSLLNMEKIGFNVQVYLLIKTSENQANELEKYLMENPNVNSMVKINGNWNFIVEALFRNINALELFDVIFFSFFFFPKIKFKNLFFNFLPIFSSNFYSRIIPVR